MIPRQGRQPRTRATAKRSADRKRRARLHPLRVSHAAFSTARVLSRNPGRIAFARDQQRAHKQDAMSAKLSSRSRKRAIKTARFWKTRRAQVKRNLHKARKMRNAAMIDLAQLVVR